MKRRLGRPTGPPPPPRSHAPVPCPNDPPCGHPAFLHDSGYLDLVEVCVPGCPCRRDLERVVVNAIAEVRILLGAA